MSCVAANEDTFGDYPPCFGGNSSTTSPTFGFCYECKTKILTTRLKKHLQKCPVIVNRLRKEQQIFFQPDINYGCSGATKLNSSHDVTPEYLSMLLEKLYGVETQLAPFLTKYQFCAHHCSEVSKNKLQPASKDSLQCTALALCLSQASHTLALSSGGTLVEMCAGRGNLSAAVMKVHPFSKLFLIDRRPYRFKADRFLRRQCELIRLTIDLKDLNLFSLPELVDTQVTFVGKHLCGKATDFALRCALSKLRDREKTKFAGMVIAPCCHHACTWSSFVNTAFLQKLGFDESDFPHLVRMTSWATIGNSEKRNMNLPCGTDTESVLKSETNALIQACRILGIDAVEKKMVGRIVKLLLNVARVLWCKEMGFNVALQEFVDSTVTPENHIIVVQ